MGKVIAATTAFLTLALSATAALATLPPPPTRAPHSFPAMTGAFDTNALWEAAQRHAISTSYTEQQRVMGAQGAEDRAILSVSHANPWAGGTARRTLIREACTAGDCQLVAIEIRTKALFGVYQGFGNTGGPSEHAAVNFNPTAMVTALQAQGVTPSTLASANLSFLADYPALTRTQWMEATQWTAATCPAITAGLAGLEGAELPVDFAGVGNDARSTRPPIQGFNAPVLRIATLGAGEPGTIQIEQGTVGGIVDRAIALFEEIKTRCTGQPLALTAS
jgi:hypothetical protein